jgi:hypothetical protein
VDGVGRPKLKAAIGRFRTVQGLPTGDEIDASAEETLDRVAPIVAPEGNVPT